MFIIDQIEITGFKSYCEKTILSKMDPIFNSITGTNGSGKSNILDAICFVLGLSNLSIIRANKLEDLVFQGEGKNTNFTEVKIILKSKSIQGKTLGFETKKSLSISRQILLGGKNRYFLGDEIVQPSKILNFFYSLNININNPHFLVRQGHIVRITQMDSKGILDLVENGLGTKLYETKRKTALEIMYKKREKLKEINSILKGAIKPQLDLIKKSNLYFKKYEVFLGLNQKLKSLQMIFQEENIQKKKKLFQTKKRKFFVQLSVSLICRDFKFRFSKIFFLQNILRSLEFCVKIAKKPPKSDTFLEQVTFSFSFFFEKLKKELSNLMRKKKKIEILGKKKSEMENFLPVLFIRQSKNLLGNKAQALEKSSGKKHPFFPPLIITKSGASYESLLFLTLCIKKIFSISRFLFGCSRIFWQSFLLKIEKGISDYFFFQLKKKALAKKNFSKVEKYISSNFKTGKVKASCILDFSEACIVDSNLILWDLRKFIKGTVTSSIQIKYSNLTTAFEFLSQSLSDCWIVQNEIYSKRILEEGNLRKRIFIIPLDNISLIAEENFNKCVEKNCSQFLSFEEKIYKAIRFVFGKIKIARDILHAKKIAFSNENSHSCVTLEGEKFEPYGSIIAGKNEDTGLCILGLCSEINNFKQKFGRVGGILKKIKFKNVNFFKFDFYECKKNGLNNFFQKNIMLKKKVKSVVLSFFLLSFTCKKKKILDDFLKKIKKNLSNKEKTEVYSSKFLIHFFQKKKKKTQEEKKNFLKSSKLSKKIKILSHRFLKKINNFQQIKKIFIGRFNKFREIFFNSLWTFLIIFIVRSAIKKKGMSVQYQKIVKFKSIFHFSMRDLFKYPERERKSLQKKNGCKAHSTNNGISFFSEKLEVSLKKNFFQNSILYSKNSFDFFDIDSIRYAMKSSKKYQDLIQKRATVEKDRLIIEDIIEKLDLKKKEILNQNIRKINSSFQRIFKLLIPGWSARLVSIRSRNGSWKGINFSIYFGKTKKKTLKELSGGQKSILALSLIFSTLISKPVPFYILDEIDAALDICYTENIGKIIKTNLEISQFIVVSLKRGIIENSNVIFKVKSIKGKSFVTKIEKKVGEKNQKANPF